ncbi:MAG: hypothetical protein PHQ75_00260 [Thermoguttaceae bacterium]|nr:hypothetical protein [Thermoguttaceae bacterium]
MVQDIQTQKFVELLKNDHRFSIESYRLVNEALVFANEQSAKEEAQAHAGDISYVPSSGASHVSGQDLCRAVRDYALLQYGMLARSVLRGLGIRKTSDIGDIVYNLINIGYMSKTKEDCPEDFDDVFELTKELENGFEFKSSDKEN